MSSAPHPHARGRHRVAATGAIVLAAAGLAAAATSPAAAATRDVSATKILTSAVIPGLDKLTDLGAVPTSQPMTVGVALARNTAAIDAEYKALYTKGSSTYHDFLTPAQFTAQFGIDPAVSAATATTLERYGLTASYVASDGSYLELTGTAAQVEATFDTTLENFSIAGKTYYANTIAATVPDAVSAVLGLTSFTTSHTDALTKPSGSASTRVTKPKAVTAAAQEPTEDQDTCTAGAGYCVGVTSPAALWSAYDMPNNQLVDDPIHPSATDDYGQGQQIAIFGEGDLTQVVKDLRSFEDSTTVDNDTSDDKPMLPHIPVVENLLPDDDQSDTSGLGEWDLDSQSSTGMSPDLAELQYYFGDSLSDSDIAATYSAWADDANGAAIGNSSFGGCEPLEAVTGDEATDDAFLEQATIEGRTMFASTGDTGSGGCVVGVDLNGLGNGGVPAIEYPSASPYAVAVGGTVFYSAASLAGVQTIPAVRANEYAWTFTGGGNSYAEPAPADQLALGGTTPAFIPCILTPSGGVPTTVSDCRQTPDIAAQSGDIVTNAYGIVESGAQTETGGTSLSSPLSAGIWARIRAAHASTCSAFGSTDLGFAQPLYYDVAESSTANDEAAFFDVGGTTDSIPAAGNGSNAALPRNALTDPTGYDNVSGLGVIDVSGMAKQLDCGSTAPVSTAVPDSDGDTVLIIGSSTGTDVPEAPLPVLIIGAGVVAAGSGALARRRRKRQRA
jgi:subtilase family serine protease